jgi:cytochrome c oxidase subunit II
MAAFSSWCRFVVVLWCCGACSIQADRSPRSETSAAVARNPNIDRGRAVYLTCSTCHGDSGEGKAWLHTPGLANLESWYAYTQLKNFKKGIRGYLQRDSAGVQMAAMAQSLKDSTEMLDVIAYIETLADVKVMSASNGNPKKGARTYQTLCGACHGPGAKGNEKMHSPRLNGLEPWYIKSQIAKFKTSLRGAHPKDIYGAPMVSMMGLLKDDQAIDDVIAYIQSTVRSVSQ